ncbi:ATP-binding protein [Pseudonocardia sp. ICBG1034]|uniref:ATP-binding protein n=1 Tax=Pseudonocardia sp. ICBG1034 TaxID=2844381 RepID=UPI001CCC6D8C|nr:DUF87 domain-containing protein [Pseudonocardia sp. ICBG1034]
MVAVTVQDIDLFRLLVTPRPPRPGDGDDPTPVHLSAAMTATHAAFGSTQDALVVAGRLRAPGQPDVQIVLGGRPWFPPAVGTDAARDTSDVPVLCPPGARGVPLASGALEEMTSLLGCWVACTGQDDPLWLPNDAGPPASDTRGSFDDYVAHLHGGFGWIVLAEPVPATELEDELTVLAAEVPQMRKRENSERHRVELARAESRYRELSRARVTGMWRVRVLVGGETTAEARTAAALLCSAGELERLPYVLVPGTDVLGFSDAAGKSVESGAARSPFLASSELVAALARPPARELPGIRLADRPTFDVTPELPGSGVPLGRVLDGAGRPAGEFTVPTDTLNRHAFVCGATGSGKSQTMRALLEGLTRQASIPWLVIEPAKAEYARMAGRIAGVNTVTVIRPGAPDVPPASLNPLEPEPGFPLQSHADLVRALFLASFDAHEPFPQVLSRALSEVYAESGWNLVTDEPRPRYKPKLRRSDPDVEATPRYPTLGMLQTAASRVVAGIGYGKEITADVRGFVDVRMGSLREGRPGRFFEGGHPLDVEKLLDGNVVLELEDITNDQDKAFLIGAVLIRVVEHLRVRGPRTGLQHVTVVEEAHRLLRNASDGPAAAAVELFASLLAEIRAYGEGVVVVEQIPSKIVPDVVKNSALKVLHRLPSADDRDVVGSTMNLQPEQSEQVVAFAPGVAAVTVDGMDRPVMLRVPPGEGVESADGAVRVAPLAGTRSPLCGDACRSSPCTLRAISDDADVAAAPGPVMWVELVTLSVLTGEPPPRPAPSVRAALVDDGERRRRCRLVGAVERSIGSRSPELRDWVDLDDLREYLLSTMDALLDGATLPGDWLRFTAGFFRWDVVREALRSNGDWPVHPHTEAWADLGIVLPGPTRAEQLAQLKAHPSYRDGAEQVVLGDPARSGLTEALRVSSGGDDENAVRRAVWLWCGSAVSATFPRLVADLLDERRKVN